MRLETDEITRVASEKQDAAGFRNRSSTLAVMPSQVSPECAEGMLAELRRTRAALRVENGKVERLKSAMPALSLGWMRQLSPGLREEM